MLRPTKQHMRESFCSHPEMHSCCALLPFTKYSYWWGEAPAEFTGPTLGADQPSRLYLSAPTTHWEESATSYPPGTGWLRSSSVAAVVIFEGDLRLFFDHPPEAPWPPSSAVRPLFPPGSRVPRGSCTAGRPGGPGWAPKQTCVSASYDEIGRHVIQDCLSSRVGLPSEHGCGCDLGEDVPSGHHGGFRS
jgi:hypothetical protein